MRDEKIIQFKKRTYVFQVIDKGICRVEKIKAETQSKAEERVHAENPECEIKFLWETENYKPEPRPSEGGGKWVRIPIILSLLFALAGVFMLVAGKPSSRYQFYASLISLTVAAGVRLIKG